MLNCDTTSDHTPFVPATHALLVELFAKLSQYLSLQNLQVWSLSNLEWWDCQEFSKISPVNRSDQQVVRNWPS